MRNNEKNQGENKDLLATWITRSSRVMTEKGLGWRMTERGNGAGMTGAGNGTRVTGAEKMGFRWGVSLLAMKRSVSLLAMVIMFPALAQAQVCTTTPDCAALGYTSSSCPNGGVKCPWGNKWFCGKTETPPVTPPVVKNGVIDGLYYCNGSVRGVAVPGTNVVMALQDAIITSGVGSAWYSWYTTCSAYVFCGTAKGRLPTEPELSALFNNLNSIKTLITSNGGYVPQAGYWTSRKCPYGPPQGPSGEYFYMFCQPNNNGSFCSCENEYSSRPICRPVMSY